MPCYNLPNGRENFSLAAQCECSELYLPYNMETVSHHCTQLTKKKDSVADHNFMLTFKGKQRLGGL